MTNKKFTRERFVDFVETEQYDDIEYICEYAIHHRIIALIVGDAGIGKSLAARHFVNSQPLITANGRSPVLYVQLKQSDKTDRTVLNALVAAINGQPQRRDTAAVAMAEVRRLIQKYRIQEIIIDEAGYLEDSGLKAVLTLYDPGEGDDALIPVVLIITPDYKDKIERLPQLNSRIAQRLELSRLEKAVIGELILPNVSNESHITFSPEQADAKEIINELFTASGGTDQNAGAIFRDLVDILIASHTIIQESVEDNAFQMEMRQLFEEDPERFHLEYPGEEVPEGDPPEPMRFSVDVIRIAAAESKGRGVRRRRRV
jgi:type II secretory pathway predicted ATPase ExeA